LKISITENIIIDICDALVEDVIRMLYFFFYKKNLPQLHVRYVGYIINFYYLILDRLKIKFYNFFRFTFY
jgi:hypothetical protein